MPDTTDHLSALSPPKRDLVLRQLQEIALVVFFRHPTIASLANALEHPSLREAPNAGHDWAARRRERKRPKVLRSMEGSKAGSG